MDHAYNPKAVVLFCLWMLLILQGTAARSFSSDQTSLLKVDSPLEVDVPITNTTDATVVQSYQDVQIVLGVAGFLAVFVVTAMIYKETMERKRHRVINSYRTIGQTTEGEREETARREQASAPEPAQERSYQGSSWSTDYENRLKDQAVFTSVETKPKFPPDVLRTNSLEVLAEVHVEEEQPTLPPTYDEVLVHLHDEVLVQVHDEVPKPSEENDQRAEEEHVAEPEHVQKPSEENDQWAEEEHGAEPETQVEHLEELLINFQHQDETETQAVERLIELEAPNQDENSEQGRDQSNVEHSNTSDV